MFYGKIDSTLPATHFFVFYICQSHAAVFESLGWSSPYGIFLEEAGKGPKIGRNKHYPIIIKSFTLPYIGLSTIYTTIYGVFSKRQGYWYSFFIDGRIPLVRHGFRGSITLKTSRFITFFPDLRMTLSSPIRATV